MRIQPDVTKGMLKVTVGCLHDGGPVWECTDTIWMELADLLKATEFEPGEAFAES